MDPRTDRFLLKACVRCGGDLALDDGDWQCLQCGRYYYARRKADTPLPGDVLSRWREQLRRPLPGDVPPSPQKDLSALPGMLLPWRAVALTSW